MGSSQRHDHSGQLEHNEIPIQMAIISGLYGIELRDRFSRLAQLEYRLVARNGSTGSEKEMALCIVGQRCCLWPLHQLREFLTKEQLQIMQSRNIIRSGWTRTRADPQQTHGKRYVSVPVEIHDLFNNVFNCDTRSSP